MLNVIKYPRHQDKKRPGIIMPLCHLLFFFSSASLLVNPL